MSETNTTIFAEMTEEERDLLMRAETRSLVGSKTGKPNTEFFVSQIKSMEKELSEMLALIKVCRKYRGFNSSAFGDGAERCKVIEAAGDLYDVAASVMMNLSYFEE